MDVAEFAKVVNVVKKMCGSHEDCDGCPLEGTGGCSLLIITEFDAVEKIERAAMEWLARKEERNG